MKKPFLSIIMPVYNGEKWLNRSIESILSQSYNNFELLIINDCSTDCSLSICESYASKDIRIHLFNLERNKGVSAATNIGLENANGELILFADDDDEYLDGAFEIMVNNHKKEDQMSFFGIKVISDGDERCFCVKKDHLSFSEVIRELYWDFPFYPNWGKVYDAKIIKDYSIRFKEDCKEGQDHLFNIDYLSHINSSSVYPQIVYAWHTEANNNSLSKNRNKILTTYDNRKTYYDYYINKVPSDVRQIVQDNYVIGLYYTLRCLGKMHNPSLHKELFSRCRDFRKNAYSLLSRERRLKINQLIRFAIFMKLDLLFSLLVCVRK